MAEASSILIASRGQRPAKYGALTRGSQPFQKFSVHKLKPSDTITGLAVKYGVAVDEIKRANNLWTGDIFLRSELKIPVKAGATLADSDHASASESDEAHSRSSHREKSKAKESKSEPEASSADVSPDDFFKKFDVKILKIKGSVEKIESESSYSEEDAVNNSSSTKRGRYYRTHRQATSFLSPSTDEDVMTVPELYVKSDTGEGRDISIQSDEHFFSL